MSIRLRQIALVAKKLAPVIEDLKGMFGLEVVFRRGAAGGLVLEAGFDTITITKCPQNQRAGSLFSSAKFAIRLAPGAVRSI